MTAGDKETGMTRETEGIGEAPDSELIEPRQLPVPEAPRRRLWPRFPGVDLWAVALAILGLATMAVSLAAGLQNH